MTSLHISWIFLATISLHVALGSTIHKRETVQIAELDPIQQALLSDETYVSEVQQAQGDRDKRLAVIKSVGIKAILLNLIFGKIDGFLDEKTRLINQLDKQNVIKNEKYFGFTTPRPTASSQGIQKFITLCCVYDSTKRPTGSTEEPIEFSTSSPVSLVIPDRLYGNSFGLVTNISMTIGDVLFNTAGRAQEFSDRISAKIRRQFGFASNLLGPSTASASTKS